MPTPTQTPIAGLIKVISSRSVQVAVLSLVASFLVAFGAPDELQKHVDNVLTGIWVLAAAIIGSWGYQDGKLNEGTIPEGRDPVAPPADTTPPKTVEAVPAVTNAQIVAAINSLAKRISRLEPPAEPPADGQGKPE